MCSKFYIEKKKQYVTKVYNLEIKKMHPIFQQNNFMFVIVFVCLGFFVFFLFGLICTGSAPPLRRILDLPLRPTKAQAATGIQVVYFHPMAYIFERSRHIWMYGWNYLNYVLSATTCDKQQQQQRRQTTTKRDEKK